MKHPRLLVVGAVFALYGCAANVEIVSDDMGRETMNIDCSGRGGSWASCLNRANDFCNNGYLVVDRQGIDATEPRPEKPDFRHPLPRQMTVRCR
jgi:hypothetical protein